MKNTWFQIDLSNKYNGQWLVYSLHNKEGKMLYIGVSDVLGIYSLSDVRKHPMFSSFFPDGIDIYAHIHEAFKNKRDGHIWKYQYLNDKPWPSIMKYFSSYRGKVAIRCIDTGEVFPSITECAKAHGINASNLSKHLRGDSNYRTVGGKKYEHAKYYRANGTGVPTPY